MQPNKHQLANRMRFGWPEEILTAPHNCFTKEMAWSWYDKTNQRRKDPSQMPHHFVECPVCNSELMIPVSAHEATVLLERKEHLPKEKILGKTHYPCKKCIAWEERTMPPDPAAQMSPELGVCKTMLRGVHGENIGVKPCGYNKGCSKPKHFQSKEEYIHEYFE